MSARVRLSLDALLMSLALVAGVGSSLVAALGPEVRTPGVPVLVVAPPWGQAAAALVLAAGGQPVGPPAAPFGTLAVFDQPVPLERLAALGAWTVRDARTLASLCGVSS